MSFVNGDFQEAIDSPERLCPEKLGGVLAAFPPVALPTHERGGFRFNPPPCGQAIALDPDFCISTVKMDPQSWRPERDGIIGALQSAVNCSHGVTDDDLRSEAENAIRQNLSRAIEADLIDALTAEAVSGGLGHSALCALAEAAMFLASQGECQTGVIIGPVDWFTALGKDNLIWNGTYHTDVNGNIVLSHSVDNSTVFAFDSNVIIKTSDVELLDEHMPGQRNVNDRVVRAEMIYAIAIAPCAVGSWGFDCTAGSGGGGGGGGGVQNPCNCQFQITNFPANQNVTVTGPVDINGPVDVTLDEPIDVNVLNFPAEVEITNDVGNPIPVTIVSDPADCCPINIGEGCTNIGSGTYVAIRNGDGSLSLIDPITGGPVTQADIVDCAANEASATSFTLVAEHRLIGDADPAWTSADVVGGTLTSITFTVLSGTATVTDSNGTVAAGLPAGVANTWEVDPDSNGTLDSTNFAVDAVGGQTYVTWTVRV